jgi:hypothetical protein
MNLDRSLSKPSPRSPRWTRAGSALLVDPDPVLLAERHRLLMRASLTVFAVTAPTSLYELQPPEEPFVALVSSALGKFQLSAVTEYVRHRWPRVRILIVGEAFPHLEDQLYDDAVSSSCEQEILIAVERCRALRS